MKQVEVQIMGQSYLLGCPDGGETRLREAVDKVDGAMCRIRDAGKVKARDRIAVLAALNLAFDLGERQAVQAAVPTPAPARDEGDGRDAQALDAPVQQRLAQLLQRLDGALGEDGRLL
mgnify:CR=1 FL=1